MGSSSRPNVFAALATAKAQTAGVYLSGLPLSAAPILTLWGLPLVVSAALAAGTAIVGSFRRGGAIYRKGTYRLDISNSHSDFFIKNLVAIRCGARVPGDLQAQGVRAGHQSRGYWIRFSGSADSPRSDHEPDQRE